MQLFQDLFDQSKQLNQAPSQAQLAYHAQKGRYKIIHQGLMIPNLPAPLHYLNFLSVIGQPNVPMLRNESAIHSTALDTATIIASVSPHMRGQLNSYSVEKECQFKKEYFKFADRELISGCFPHFRIQREDKELSFDLSVTTSNIISYFTKLRMGLADHWSALCQCEGQIVYKGQKFEIQQMGCFEYARSINFSYLPLVFFTYQIINLENNRQLLLAQIRDPFNSIVQSRLYLRDAKMGVAQMFDDHVRFKVHRVYPKVKTPNGQYMYLPREFEWGYEGKDGTCISVQAQSRGDFKFGLAAGYVGSFKYQIKINHYEEMGESGYCEYIDCRSLNWQEKDKEEKMRDELVNTVPFACKK
ncbi:DUF6670 family protein [Acinetobacter sp. ANC 5414]|uniref:DUF6670 family protein n=1 Tax=Acinetobacter sp. ANC 5414 TaxID=2731251 RepID=UPI00148F593D|nr:DUF6670 family protein [Acinetobacter sp. ANC 5414]NNH02202.1 hypothetical protein [Acinetobacter sp. ANC 5414]